MTAYKIAFAADDTNECVTEVVTYLESVAEVVRPTDSDSWPDMASAVGAEVADGRANFGILMCWTGTGTAIAANKVKGIRAAQASEPWIAENARRWNDANILTLSLKRTAPDMAVECVAAFLGVDGPDDEEVDNIAKLADK